MIFSEMALKNILFYRKQILVKGCFSLTTTSNLIGPLGVTWQYPVGVSGPPPTNSKFASDNYWFTVFMSITPVCSVILLSPNLIP